MSGDEASRSREASEDVGRPAGTGMALPSGADVFHRHVIPTERCGALHVWVQGDLALARNEGKEQYPVFLTVHDVGLNHNRQGRFSVLIWK